jgi:hypothetical protein
VWVVVRASLQGWKYKITVLNVLHTFNLNRVAVAVAVAVARSCSNLSTTDAVDLN